MTLDVSVEEAELKAQEAQAALAETLLGRMSAREAEPGGLRDGSRPRARRARRRDRQHRAHQGDHRPQDPPRAVPRAGRDVRRPLGQYLSVGTRSDDAAGRRRRDPRRLLGRAARSPRRLRAGRQGRGRRRCRAPRPFAATIVAIDARVDPMTRNAMVRARIQGAESARARRVGPRPASPSARRAPSLTDPGERARKGPAGDHVFVVAPRQDGQTRAAMRPRDERRHARRRRPRPSGLAAGESVAASGSFKLRDGVLVAVDGRRGARVAATERPTLERHAAARIRCARSPTSSSSTRCSRSSSTSSSCSWDGGRLTSLPVQQYPKIESSSVLITTVYIGASAETVRGFLTTPIERAVSAISGVDYIESTSRAGVSIVTVRLKLNHSSTAALAEITARLQQVRSELPPEAEPPDRRGPARRPAVRLLLPELHLDRARRRRHHRLAVAHAAAPARRRSSGVQRVAIEGGRPIAMRIWIDPDRLAALNLSPGDVHAALRRNNYLAAVGRTKGNLVQINLLANTDLRSIDEFEDLIVADREGAIVRLERRRARRARRRRGRPDRQVQATARPSTSASGRSPGSNEIDVAHRLRDEMERLRPTLPQDIDMRLAYDATVFMENALKEITKTLSETIMIVGFVVFLFMGSVRTALVPLVAMPVSLVGAGDRHARVRVQPEPPDHARDRPLGRARRRRRDRRRRERRAARARGPDADPGGADRRPRARRADHRDDDHARRGLRADRVPGRAHRHAVPRVRDHARRGRRRLGHRGGDALPRDELALRPRARQGGTADEARQPGLRRSCAARYARMLGRRARDALGDRRRGARSSWPPPGPSTSNSRTELAPVEDQGHVSMFLEASPDATLEAVEPRVDRVLSQQSPRSPRPTSPGRSWPRGAASAAW